MVGKNYQWPGARILTRNSPLVAYGVALLSVAIALVASQLLQDLIEPLPVALFYLAVALSAWYGGSKPGMVATLLSTLAVNYHFVPPYNSLKIVDPGSLLRLGVFVVVALLISSLNDAQQAALRRERQFWAVAESAQRRTTDLLEHMTDAFVAFDRSWRFTYANPAALKLLQKSSEALIGKHVWEEVLPGEVDGLAYRKLHQAVEEQVPISWEEYNVPTQRWIEARAYPSAEGVSLYFQDISERKQAQLDLRQSEAKLRLAITSARMVSWTWNARTDQLVRSETASDILGLPPEAITSNSAEGWSLVHPDDLDRHQAIVAAAIADHTHYTSEFRIVRPDNGAVIWVQDRGQVTYDDRGEVLSIEGVLFDITDRRRTEEALRQSETILDAFFASSPVGMAFFDLDWRYVYANEALATTNGLPLSEHFGRTLREILPQWAPTVEPIFEQIVQTKTPLLNQEVMGVTVPANLVRYGLVNYFPVCLADGNLIGIGVTSLDITERKQAQEDLRRSEAAFRIISNAAPAFLWVSSPEGEISFLNDRWYEFTGQTQAEAMGFGWASTLHPEDLERILPYWEQCRQMGEPYEGELRYRRHDGEYCWFAFRALPYCNAEGDIEAWYGLSIDISDRKQAEIALGESERRFRRLVESNMFGVAFGDFAGGLHYANNYFLNMVGYSREDLEAGDIRWRDITPPEYLPLDEQAAEELRLNGVATPFEKEYIRPDGSRVPVLIGSALLDDPGKQQPEVIAFYLDLTTHKQAEAEREQLLSREQAAREQAEAANRIKDEFLAVVSHELRSPLNPILGWAKLLRQRQLDAEKVERALEVIERNAKVQAQLIDDLLDVSRILRGKLSLDKRPVNLVPTIQAALETVRLAAEAKNIQIHTQLAPEVGQVAGDVGRLQQVVWNLLSNAVKFTPEGGRIEIKLAQLEVSPEAAAQSADSTPATPPSPQAVIIVTDTGTGIPRDFLPYVFEQFRQESSATTRRFGGLGLGLAIVRYLVELHGGIVYADSPGQGQGATFTVQLPLMPHPAPTGPSAAPGEPSLDLQGTRILVVDDDDNTREYVVFLLELYGAEVVAAASAVEAIKAFSRCRPEVLLSDIGMPDVDGYMLMRQIRALLPEQGSMIPAIALTAYAGEIDYQQAMAAGFHRHITKPIEPELLIKAIAAVKESRYD